MKLMITDIYSDGRFDIMNVETKERKKYLHPKDVAAYFQDILGFEGDIKNHTLIPWTCREFPTEEALKEYVNSQGLGIEFQPMTDGRFLFYPRDNWKCREVKFYIGTNNQRGDNTFLGNDAYHYVKTFMGAREFDFKHGWSTMASMNKHYTQKYWTLYIYVEGLMKEPMLFDKFMQ